MPAIRRACRGGLELVIESRTQAAAGDRHYPMLLFLARLSVLWRRSQVVRQRSAKPPFVGSIPTGASLRHNNLGPPWWRPSSRVGRVFVKIAMAKISPQLDVAISFLNQDLGVVQELRDRLAPALDVFVYTHKQEDLAGTASNISECPIIPAGCRIHTPNSGKPSCDCRVRPTSGHAYLTRDTSECWQHGRSRRQGYCKLSDSDGIHRSGSR